MRKQDNDVINEFFDDVAKNTTQEQQERIEKEMDELIAFNKQFPSTCDCPDLCKCTRLFLGLAD